MNIVLFESDEIGQPLVLSDERAKHILGVLGRQKSDTFDAGVIDGKRGKATVDSIGTESISLSFDLQHEEPYLYPIDLIVGLSRPQTNRKILQEATSMGVRSLSFVTTERGEASYATSKLWTTREWRRHVVAGVVQAFTTRMPQVSFGISLKVALEARANAEVKIALDNYEADLTLSEVDRGSGSIALVLGSERGWSGAEREMLLEHHFQLAHLGPRPLRTETAVVAGIAVLLR
jgi:RsmE family RNA methyltransferase